MNRRNTGSKPAMTDNSTFIALEDPGADTIKAPVLKVFDGDGFLARIRTSEFSGNPADNSEFEATVRFGFIDAPELEQPGGVEAKEFLSSLIGGRWVDLVVLTKMDTGRSVDRYGRIVCVPFMKEEYVGSQFRTRANRMHHVETFSEPLILSRNIELEMVLNGWAWVLDRYGPDERYLEALEHARRKRRGIWAHDDNVHPWEFKKGKHRQQRKPQLVAEQMMGVRCPAEGCNGNLVRRNGSRGPFLGCSNFPDCRYTRSVGQRDGPNSA